MPNFLAVIGRTPLEGGAPGPMETAISLISVTGASLEGAYAGPIGWTNSLISIRMTPFAGRPAHPIRVTILLISTRVAPLGGLCEPHSHEKLRLVVVSHTKRVPKNCLFLEPTQGNKNDPQNARNQW